MRIKRILLTVCTFTAVQADCSVQTDAKLRQVAPATIEQFLRILETSGNIPVSAFVFLSNVPKEVLLSWRNELASTLDSRELLQVQALLEKTKSMQMNSTVALEAAFVELGLPKTFSTACFTNSHPKFKGGFTGDSQYFYGEGYKDGHNAGCAGGLLWGGLGGIVIGSFLMFVWTL